MKRVYEYFTTFSFDDTIERKDRITESELEFLESLELIDLYFDGNKYSWAEESEDFDSITIMVCTEKELLKVKEIDFKLHHDAEGYSKVTDVTDEVLMGIYDCDRYGFAREAIMIMLYDWRKMYLEEDDLLDKINKYGADSLTQQEKDFLETGELKNPFLYEIIEDDLED